MATHPQYNVVEPGAGPAEAERIGLALAPGESLLGVYVNPPGAFQSRVALTSTRVVTQSSGGWSGLAYATLETVRFSGAPADWDTVTLVAKGGAELVVLMLDDIVKPVCTLSGYLRKVSPADSEFVNRPPIDQTPWFGPGGRREKQLGYPYPDPAEHTSVTR